MLDGRHRAVLDYLARLQTSEGEARAIDLEKLVIFVNHLPEADNAHVIGLYERHHTGERFTPSPDVAKALRQYDGSEPAAFFARLRLK